MVFLDSWFSRWRKYISTGWIFLNRGLSNGLSGCSYWFIRHQVFYLHLNDLWISTHHENISKGYMCRIKSPPQSDDKNYKFEPVRLLKRLGSLKCARRKTAFLINKVVNRQQLIFFIWKTYAYCTGFQMAYLSSSVEYCSAYQLKLGNDSAQFSGCKYRGICYLWRIFSHETALGTVNADWA